MIEGKQRIDTWLWAARFFKTRSLSCKAIDAGHVKWNGTTVKPAREVKVGDELEIRSGEQVFHVVIKGLHALRRPAPEARTMFEETEASLAARIKASEMRKLSPTPGADIRGRPTKKDARQIRRVRGG
jgi:ribosome-associated heat shock protein Hsp15